MAHAEQSPSLALRSRLAFWRKALCSSTVALARAIWLLITQPADLWLAIRAPIQLARLVRNPGPDTTPALVRHSPGIWRVPTKQTANELDPEPGEELVLLQYTGTGESVHAAYENTRRLFEADPRLAHATHYVFEAPLDHGAYYGPEAFGASAWQRVEPIVAHYAGPFVLVGVSRGGLVALDHGARIAEEHGKVASVLALSAPVAAPSRIPRVIAGIAGFVEALEGLSSSLAHVPAWVRREIETVVRFFYAAFIALILRFHRVYSLPSLARHALDVRDHGVLGATLRATREFRLLVRANQRKLQLHCQLMNQALVQHRARFSATLVWGANDGWIDAETCHARFLEVAQKASAEVLPTCVIMKGQGHLLRAEDTRVVGELTPFFAHAVSEACRLGRLPDPDAAAARRVENELHLAGRSEAEQ